MQFRTEVHIDRPPFLIDAFERMLFVGSCFADSIGRRFAEEKFKAVVNPFGVMYNPASILHTVQRYNGKPPQTVVFTLGTNHIYILKATGEIVDNCQKRPQTLFEERALSIDECEEYIVKAIETMLARRQDTRFILTVSPIRYAKYGFHGSALSKATLLLAAERVAKRYPTMVYYFPAYEIVNDELRDYRFYSADMLHPSDQAIEYIWERFAASLLTDRAKTFIREWLPIKLALAHRPLYPDSDEYRKFKEETAKKLQTLAAKYPELEEERATHNVEM